MKQKLQEKKEKLSSTESQILITKKLFFFILLFCHGLSSLNAARITRLGGATIPVNLGSDVILCAGDSVILDAGYPGATYLWSTGDTTETIVADTTGNYSVTVYYSGCTGYDQIHVTVLPELIVDLGADTTLLSCHHDSLLLDAGAGGTSYLWSTDDTTQTISVYTTGTYYVEVTNAGGCTASDTINVVIDDHTVEVNLGNDTALCTCILLSAGNPGATFNWCSGENYPILNVCTSGTYCVTVSNGLCMSSDTINIIIAPPPVINLTVDSTNIGSGMLTIDAGAGAASWIWSTGDTTQSITVTTAGIIYVTAFNSAGCSVSDTIMVGKFIGIAENVGLQDMNVSIYPNPTEDKTFTVELTGSERSHVQLGIIDVLGNVVYASQVKDFSGSYKTKISLEDLAPGLYFADIRQDNKRIVKKITLR